MGEAKVPPIAAKSFKLILSNLTLAATNDFARQRYFPPLLEVHVLFQSSKCLLRQRNLRRNGTTCCPWKFLLCFGGGRHMLQQRDLAISVLVWRVPFLTLQNYAYLAKVTRIDFNESCLTLAKQRWGIGTGNTNETLSWLFQCRTRNCALRWVQNRRHLWVAHAEYNKPPHTSQTTF